MFGEHNFYVYQNVQTGGFMHVENNEEGTNITEGTTATLWVKIVADTHYYQYVHLVIQLGSKLASAC